MYFKFYKSSILLTILTFCCKLSEITAAKTNFVTCGSIIKLLNSDIGHRLHSHDVKYGSGSGQQSVTGVEQKEDVNSHWLIKAPTKQNCDRGEPIKCGDIIRLEHLATKKNLHSHYFQSPLSNEQEVSAYGNDGLGDTGDHWELICSDGEWARDAHVKFRHVDTDKYLAMTGRTFGRPISGQMEVVGLNGNKYGTKWTTAEGLYIVPSSKDSSTEYSHNEL